MKRSYAIKGSLAAATIAVIYGIVGVTSPSMLTRETTFEIPVVILDADNDEQGAEKIEFAPVTNKLEIGIFSFKEEHCTPVPDEDKEEIIQVCKTVERNPVACRDYVNVDEIKQSVIDEFTTGVVRNGVTRVSPCDQERTRRCQAQQAFVLLGILITGWAMVLTHKHQHSTRGELTTAVALFVIGGLCFLVVMSITAVDLTRSDCLNCKFESQCGRLIDTGDAEPGAFSAVLAERQRRRFFVEDNLKLDETVVDFFERKGG